MGKMMMAKDIFRPKLFVMYPKNKLPIIPPHDNKETIHDDSSIVIFPDANGVWSDVSNKIFDEAQPSAIPKTIGIKFTAEKMVHPYFLAVNKMLDKLPANAAKYWYIVLSSSIALADH